MILLNTWEEADFNINHYGIESLKSEYKILLKKVELINNKIGVENNQEQMRIMYRLKLNIEGFQNKTFVNIFYIEQTKLCLKDIKKRLNKAS